MFDLLNRFWRDEDGVAVMELALVTPIFLMMFLSTVELGHMIYYSITVEKSLRSAVTYAGRVTVLDAANIQATKNIVMTGEPTGTDPFLVAGWANPAAKVVFSTHQFSATLDDPGKSVFTETVIRVTAEVPYEPIVGVLIPALEYLMKTQFRDGTLYITLTHEQALVGN